MSILTRISLGLVLALLVPGCARSGNPPAAAEPQPGSVRLAATYEAAQAEAKRGRRPLVVSFYTAWCGWCRKLDQTTYRDPEVVARSVKDVVFVRLNAEDGATGSALARKLKVSGFPTQVVLDPDGGVLETLRGYRPPETFRADLARILARQGNLATLLERERKTPGDPATLLALARAFEQAQDDKEASRRYAALLALPPATAGAAREPGLLEGAKAALRLGDHDRAVAWFQALAAETKLPALAEDGLYGTAVAHHKRGDLAAARRAYDGLLARYPDGRRAAGARRALTALSTGGDPAAARP